MKQKSLHLLLSLCAAAPINILGADQSILNQELFRTIYKVNAWGAEESRSGPGSGMEQTKVIRDKLSCILEQLGTRTLLDAGCGDLFWIRTITPQIKSLRLFIGVDIVPEIVLENIKKHGDNSHVFLHLDIINDPLPKNVDTIVCRDVLAHLTFEEIFKVLRNFKKTGAKYLIATTFADRASNYDISAQSACHLLRFRPLNLQRAPFNFPEPLMIFNEQDTEQNGGIADKSFAVWCFDDLPL